MTPIKKHRKGCVRSIVVVQIPGKLIKTNNINIIGFFGRTAYKRNLSRRTNKTQERLKEKDNDDDNNNNNNNNHNHNHKDTSPKGKHKHNSLTVLRFSKGTRPSDSPIHPLDPPTAMPMILASRTQNPQASRTVTATQISSLFEKMRHLKATENTYVKPNK